MSQSLLIALLAVGNLGVAVGIQWYVLVSIGPGFETDAYVASQTLPSVIVAVLGGALTRVLVPLFSVEGKSELRSLVWEFLIVMGAIFAVLSLALFVLADYWVPILFPGFSDITRQLAIDLSRVQLVGMVFVAISAVLTAGQHAKLEFYRAELSSLVGYLAALAGVLWALPRYGITSAAWFMVVRVVIQISLVLPSFGWCRVSTLSRDHIMTVWRRVRPLLMGSTIYKLGPVVDNYLGSMAPPGGLSLLVFAQRAIGAFLQIADRAIAAPMVPTLARLAQRGDMCGFRSIYFKRVSVSLSLAAGLYVAYLFGGEPLLSWLLLYGKVGGEDASLLYGLIVVLGGMFIGGVVGQLSASGLYALAETGAVTRVALVSFLMSVIVKVVGFHYIGLYGIAIGIASYQIANAVFLNRVLVKRASEA